jgi:P27 family predicted phage terminase small subunit
MSGVKRITGRKRKPTALRLLDGKHSERTNHDEPIPDERELIAPDWLDTAARSKWDELVGICHWFTAADADMLAVYCDAWSHYLAAQRIATAPVLKTEDGRIIKNPALTALKEAWAQLRSSGSELGLSPASRASLKVEDNSRQSERVERYFRA